MLMIMIATGIVGWYAPRLVLSMKSNWIAGIIALVFAWIVVMATGLGIAFAEIQYGDVIANEAFRRSSSGLGIGLIASVMSVIGWYKSRR